MRKKLLAGSLAAVLLLAVTLALTLFSLSDSQRFENDRMAALQLNDVVELQKQIDAGDLQAQEQLDSTLAELRSNLLAENTESQTSARIAVIVGFGICFIFLFGVIFYALIRIVRPFERLESYAESVAAGNLEATLPYERTNLFGDFTWAFDRMSKEIRDARAAEAAAIENNKTAIAELSHDIKTPIASIRAYSEALEMGMDTDAETRSRYLNQIMAKCNEVAELSDDLFLHSVSDMDRLSVVCTSHNAAELLRDIADELSTDQSPLIIGELPTDVEISCDARRTKQAIGNIVANSRKYAPDSRITINAATEDGLLRITVSDTGPGVAESDAPFLLDKFYRGENVASKPGAGLGLSIVAHIAERMGGRAQAGNTPDGFAVDLWIPIS